MSKVTLGLPGVRLVPDRTVQRSPHEVRDSLIRLAQSQAAGESARTTARAASADTARILAAASKSRKRRRKKPEEAKES